MFYFEVVSYAKICLCHRLNNMIKMYETGKGDRGLRCRPEVMEGHFLDRRRADHRPQPAHHRHHSRQTKRLHNRQ